MSPATSFLTVRNLMIFNDVFLFNAIFTEHFQDDRAELKTRLSLYHNVLSVQGRKKLHYVFGLLLSNYYINMKNHAEKILGLIFQFEDKFCLSSYLVLVDLITTRVMY